MNNIINILKKQIEKTKRIGRYRSYLNLERSVNHKPWAFLHEKDTKAKKISIWCSNDYLGMSQHSEVIAATIDATKRVGVGTCGARSISGTSIYHTELESELAKIYNKEAALIFTSDFAANHATLSVLTDVIPNLAVFSDELNHASIISGIKQNKVVKKIFKHNNLEHLEHQLKEFSIDHPKIIIFESLYSMDGDFSPIKEIVDLSKKYNSLTYLDEIHSAGVYGKKGTGYAEELNLVNDITIIQGGFGKSFGSSGGYIAGPTEIIDAVKCFAPSYVFSTSTPAPIVAASLASLKFNYRHSEQREKLFERVSELKAGLRKMRIPIICDESHIIPILVGNPFTNKEISEKLLKNYNIYVQPVNAPTIPSGTERLRVTPTSTHSKKDVEEFLSAINQVWTELNLKRN